MSGRVERSSPSSGPAAPGSAPRFAARRRPPPQPFPSLNTSDPSCPIWASIYTTNQGANFGAQFVTFNVDGNPKKARSYFKTISGTTIDNFVIFAD